MTGPDHHAEMEAHYAAGRERGEAEAQAIRRAIKFADCAAGQGIELTADDGEVLDPVEICELIAKGWGVELGGPDYLERLKP